MPKYSKERKHLEDTPESRKKEKQRIARAKLRLAIKKAGGLKAYKQKRAAAKRRVAEAKRLIKSSKAENSVIQGMVDSTRGKPKKVYRGKNPGPRPIPLPDSGKPKVPRPAKRPKPKKQASNGSLYQKYLEAKRRRQEAEKAKKKK